MAKRKIDLPGRGPTEVTEVGYRTLSDEFWNEYLLDDGTRVRMKLVVTEVLKLEDEYGPDGSPVYLINSTNVVVTNSPDEIKKAPE